MADGRHCWSWKDGYKAKTEIQQYFSPVPQSLPFGAEHAVGLRQTRLVENPTRFHSVYTETEAHLRAATKAHLKQSGSHLDHSLSQNTLLLSEILTTNLIVITILT